MATFELSLIINNDDIGTSIITLIAQQCHLSNNEIKQAIHKGALWLTRGKRTNRLRRIKTSLKLNDNLHFYYNSNVLAQPIPQAKLITDFDDYSIWYKPYGMLSQGSKWSDHTTIARFAQQNLSNERSCFIVHRLDRAATGLIIIAHSKKSARLFSQIFEQHKLDKYYQVIVHNNAQPLENKKVVTDLIDNKPAKSTFTLLDTQSSFSLLQVKIETGRKHQIRKHAASINYPVVGDRLHGDQQADKQFNHLVDLQLCAVYLAFRCPITGEERKIKLPEKYRPSLAYVLKHT